MLDLLQDTLLSIRNNPADASLCFAHADHMHNIPYLIARFQPELLLHYWEIERPHFIDTLKALGHQPPLGFDAPWAVIEREYRRRCQPPAAS